MSFAPAKFAPKWSPSIQPVFDFIFRTRDLSTIASRFGQPRWSAIFRRRKFSSLERFAEPRKKTSDGDARHRIAAAIFAIAAGTWTSATESPSRAVAFSISRWFSVSERNRP